MNKSIPAFALGLIFSLIGVALAYVYWVVFVIIAAFSSEAIKTICTIIPLINICVFTISFIGSFFCLGKLKIGGIILIISSLTSIICYATTSIALKTLNFPMVLCWLPAVVILCAGTLAIKKDKKQRTI